MYLLGEGNLGREDSDSLLIYFVNQEEHMTNYVMY